ncbi:hypothetical protein BHE74_00052348 [Ensete ventricosum]|nr:hypothetical protein GW17_00016421 [Ensete ventricosum]RWW42124.1 hypothetical protein BHE74_00052348 [Ensete ventricosum]RZS23095.1 hypothetical protein BHM03_00055950 [Ensete ventricosum]
MLNSGLCPGIKSLSSVTLVFRLPYYTHWGQSLLVCGSEPVLGSWNVKQGLALGPSHEGDELIWCGKVAVSVGFSCEYSYYVVDDSRNVLRSEAGNKRRLTLPDAVREGTVVEIHDLWQEASEALFFRTAFKDVIFSGGEKSSATSDESSRELEKILDQHGIPPQFPLQ